MNVPMPRILFSISVGSGQAAQQIRPVAAAGRAAAVMNETNVTNFRPVQRIRSVLPEASEQAPTDPPWCRPSTWC
jgi:hypothetical protein